MLQVVLEETIQERDHALTLKETMVLLRLQRTDYCIAGYKQEICIMLGRIMIVFIWRLYG